LRRRLSLIVPPSSENPRIEVVQNVLPARLPVKCSTQPTMKILEGTTELQRISGSVIFLANVSKDLVHRSKCNGRKYLPVALYWPAQEKLKAHGNYPGTDAIAQCDPHCYSQLDHESRE
jgi:hypothetical protein